MLSEIAGALGKLVDTGVSLWNSNEDREQQKEFAKRGIQWRVKDAEKAGVHPLFALGAQTTSYAPTVGPATNFSGIGQDISRAVESTTPEASRMDQYTKTLQTLQVQRAGLENELLASKIAMLRQPGSPPAPPTADQRWLLDGQGSVPSLVQSSTMYRTSSDPVEPYMEPGAINELGYSRTSSGGWAPVMSGDVKQRLEEDLPGMLMWNMRNRVVPSLGLGYAPPTVPLADDMAWFYNPFSQEYIQVPKRLLNYQWKGDYAR